MQTEIRTAKVNTLLVLAEQETLYLFFVELGIKKTRFIEAG